MLVCIAASLIASCQSAESPGAQTTEKKAGQNKNPAQQTAAVVQKASGDETVAARSEEQSRKLVVYYFHTTYRCHSCTMIENLTKAAVETKFADELKSGQLEFRPVNVENAGNEHFAKDYRLYTKSVVLSQQRDGTEAQWKNLEKVWTLLRDEAKFTDYITSEVKALL
jgi:hypothetical protein